VTHLIKTLKFNIFQLFRGVYDLLIANWKPPEQGMRSFWVQNQFQV